MCALACAPVPVHACARGTVCVYVGVEAATHLPGGMKAYPQVTKGLHPRPTCWGRDSVTTTLPGAPF